MACTWSNMYGHTHPHPQACRQPCLFWHQSIANRKRCASSALPMSLSFISPSLFLSPSHTQLGDGTFHNWTLRQGKCFQQLDDGASRSARSWTYPAWHTHTHFSVSCTSSVKSFFQAQKNKRGCIFPYSQEPERRLTLFKKHQRDSLSVSLTGKAIEWKMNE